MSTIKRYLVSVQYINAGKPNNNHSSVDESKLKLAADKLIRHARLPSSFNRIAQCNSLIARLIETQEMLIRLNIHVVSLEKIISPVMAASFFDVLIIIITSFVFYLKDCNSKLLTPVAWSCGNFAIWISFCYISLDSLHTQNELLMNKFFDLISIVSRPSFSHYTEKPLTEKQ